MGISVFDLKNFYSCRGGRFVRRLLGAHINDIWDGAAGLRVMGCGYATPYLRPYLKDSERTFNVMFSSTGCHHWPQNMNEKNLVCLSAEDDLPIETETIDRILLVHGLEYAEQPDRMLQELWRVLKSNGRILIVVPNRLGLWARADWTPFGHGHPYSISQMTNHLKNNYFVLEQTRRSLFMPPFKSFLVLRTAYLFESIGRFIFPGLSGVCLIEASKQVYANIERGEKSPAMARRRRRVYLPEPAGGAVGIKRK